MESEFESRKAELLAAWGVYPTHFGVKTSSDLNPLKWHYSPVTNPVQRRIGELACLELDLRKRVVRSVSRKEVIPDRRYSWRLYADEKGTELVDVVVLDVNLGGALDIDFEVQEQLEYNSQSVRYSYPFIGRNESFSGQRSAA